MGHDYADSDRNSENAHININAPNAGEDNINEENSNVDVHDNKNGIKIRSKFSIATH